MTSTKDQSVTKAAPTLPIATVATSDPPLPLNQIVIAPLTIKIHNREFSCSGNGLQYKKHGFDPNLQHLLPLLEPARTKKGTVKVHQPFIPKTDKDFWGAQCVFRGLSPVGTKSKLQELIRTALASRIGNQMLDIYKTESERLDREFRLSNAVELERSWAAFKTDEEKVEADARRFLLERFPKRQTREERLADLHDDFVGEAIILKMDGTNDLRTFAEQLGICRQSTEAPGPPGRRWNVVGTSRRAVRDKLEEIDKQLAQVKKKREAEKTKKLRDMHEAVLQQLRRTPGSSPEKWSVEGTWTITSSPENLDSDYPPSSHIGTIELHITESPSGEAQIWARFDFQYVTGVMRFFDPGDAAARRGTSAKAGAKRSHSEMVGKNGRGVPSDDGEDNDFGDGEDVGDDEEVDDGSESDFFITSRSRPSTENPTWSYRWRGEETGEGEIALGSDEKAYTITFGGPYGTECRGIFTGVCFSGTKFIGKKIGTLKGPRNANYEISVVSNEWGGRSEAAYERARVARWH
jgi:hypothetical protein